MATEKDLGDVRYFPFLSRARIDCDLFHLKCPEQWGELRRTADPKVRQCDVCNRGVHLATSDEELIKHASLKLCVAVIRPEELPDVRDLFFDYDIRGDVDEDEERVVMGKLA